MMYLPNWFHLEWFLLALIGVVSGFIIGGSIKLELEEGVGMPPPILRSWPIVCLLLIFGALFVNILQDAVRLGCLLSGFGLGFIIRKWWSKEQHRSDRGSNG